MKIYLILICLIFFKAQLMAVEHRPYNILSKEKNIEIRYYNTIVAAEVILSGSRKEAANQAFRLLFKFISGENASNKKISMTAPVTQVKLEENLWKINFFMPSKLSLNQTPTPLQNKIILKEYKEATIASIQFSGTSKQNNLDKHEKELTNFLNQHNYTYLDSPIYAFYNPPFIPWFLRRNEVLFIITNYPTPIK